MNSTPHHKITVVIVRDRESAGGGIHNYYQSLHKHFSVYHEFVDVGRFHGFYARSKSLGLSIPTPLRLLLDWAALAVKLLRFPDLVHLNPGLDIKTRKSLRRDAVNLLLAKLFRRKVLVFWRGWDNDACGTSEFPGGNNAWLSRVYRMADAHIVLAEDFRNDLRRWKFVCPIYLETTVVSDFVVNGIKGAIPTRGDERFRLLFLSRVEVAKGVFEMLEAFSLLSSCHPGRYHLTIAGDGPALKDLKVRADQLRLKSVEFTGYVDGDEKVRCFAGASAFCFLSYTEGMPNAVLEAMAAGLPLVSSDAGGLKDILEEGATGYILVPDRTKEVGKRFSPQEVANRIERLAASEEVRGRIGRHNREYARERFAAATVARRLETIYRAVLGLDGAGGC